VNVRLTENVALKTVETTDGLSVLRSIAQGYSQAAKLLKHTTRQSRPDCRHL